MAKRNAKRRDIYQEVTDRILELLDQGVVPWRNPIKNAGQGWPVNLSSNKRYRGVNVFLLAATSWAKGYSSDYWLTFKQAQQKNGQVRKGEKSSLVVFWKQYTKTDRETGEEITLPVLKHYNVFNAEQIDGITPPDALDPNAEVTPFEPISQCEEILSGYKNPPSVNHGGNRARYRPRTDEVFMPEPAQFDTRENYYATLFHELAHSTGHSKRLDRGLDTEPAPFGSKDYSKEELVAETTAAFLAAAAGISPPTIEQAAAYIQGWSKQLRNDKKLIVSAAAAGQKAADWILGETFGAASAKEPAENTMPERSETQSADAETGEQPSLF